MGRAGLADEPLAWVSDPLAEALELPAVAEAVADALAEADALEEALELPAVAEADALADAEELELVPELPPQAARPRAVARLRDRTAIDFFTVFSFLVDPRAMPGRPIVWLFVECALESERLPNPNNSYAKLPIFCRS